MGIKLTDIERFMEERFPTRLAEDYDNVGLLIGSRSNVIKRIMVCLDASSVVVEEAVKKNVDLIVSHHPLIFKGIKRILDEDYKGNIIYKLIKNNINVYSSHTNLDVAQGGLNDYLADLLGLKDIRHIKKHRVEKLYKVVVFVPEESIEAVRLSMNGAGAGLIGNYSDCAFMTKGIGTFKPLEGTNPYIGSVGKMEYAQEYRLETIVPQKILKSVVEAMLVAHPYEEVAYDIYPLELNAKEYGLGNIGTLEKQCKLDGFIGAVKEKLDVDRVRVIGTTKSDIKNVAVFCGSFDESILSHIKGKAEVLVTGDVKYHDAADIVEMGMCVIDAGHFNTERIIVPKLAQILSGQFPGVEVVSNSREEDPFKIV